jgi:tetratricopeptide (TPR) repeat protein
VQQLFALLVLLGWAPLVVGFFLVMPSRLAVTVAIVAGWLLLPPTSLQLPGFPDFTKATAATIGILIGTLLFELPRLMAFRPSLIDLPMFVWCSSPLVSSVSNGLGWYDGCSGVFSAVSTWGLPYLIGRIYFNDLDSLFLLGKAIVVGGVCFIPPCLWEIRMSPMLLTQIYGVNRWTGVRYGGYRPKVFFATGLELGMWMTAAALAAWWLWRSGRLKQLGQAPFGLVLLPALLVTTVLCKSTGALALLAAGMFVLWWTVRFNSKLAAIGLLLICPFYLVTRTTHLWSGQQAVEIAKSLVNADRAQSLEFRFINENLLIDRALERSMLGWGGWGRNRQIDRELLRANHLKEIITDGLWIIVFGLNGLVGLTALYSAMLLPAARVMWRFPARQWMLPSVAPATAFAVLLNLYMIDCLANAMINLIYIVVAGGLAGVRCSPTLVGQRMALAGMLYSQGHSGSRHSTKQPLDMASAASLQTQSPLEKMAGRYTLLARSLKEQGRSEQAATAWEHAIEIWASLASTHPQIDGFRIAWCDAVNDLAWLLAVDPDSAVRDPDRSVALAIQVTETLPEVAPYWNTLGAAQFRQGDLIAAIASLERSMALGDGGTAFDHFYLAMALARSGFKERALAVFEEGLVWVEQHAPHHPELLLLRDEARARLERTDLARIER